MVAWRPLSLDFFRSLELVLTLLSRLVASPVPPGRELFDLYGGSHPSTNVDLLTLFGFASSHLPTDSLALVMFVCPPTPPKPSDPRAADLEDNRQLLLATLDRFEAFYAAGPLAIDELLDEHEHERYQFARNRTTTGTTGPGAAGGGVGGGRPQDVCLHSRFYQSALSQSGVAVTLPILARLAVTTKAQQLDEKLMQKVRRGHRRHRRDSRSC